MGEVRSILLTGGTGYLGSHLAQIFINAGYNLFILKRPSSNLRKIEHLLDSVSLIDIQGNNLNNIFKDRQIDCIIHTAASYGRKGETSEEVFEANLHFPSLLLKTAIENKVRYFINSGTILPRDLNSYAQSKYAFQDLLKLHANEMQMINVELQYFYGPSDDKSKFVTFIISEMFSKKSHIDLSEGIQIRDFIYIEDVVQAYLKIIINLAVFNKYTDIPVGSGKGISIKDLTREIKSLSGNGEIELKFGVLPTRNNEIMWSVADITKLASIGWKQQFSIRDGLLLTIEKDKDYYYDISK